MEKLRCIVHPVRVTSLLVFVLTVFLNQTLFAESNPATASGTQTNNSSSFSAVSGSRGQEVEIMDADRVSSVTDACSKEPAQCGSSCNAAQLAESRAEELESMAKEARLQAKKARQNAVSLEEKAHRQFKKALQAKRKNNPWLFLRPAARQPWKGVGTVARIFVPRNVEDRYRRAEWDAARYASQSPDEASQRHQETSILMVESQSAFKLAEESRKEADAADREAVQARRHAASIRQACQSCLSGKESP